MKTWIIDQGGVVVDIILLADTLVPGKDIFTTAVAATMVDATSIVGIAVGWVKSESTYVAPTVAATPISGLAALLVAAAKSASNSITSQIATTETHLAGYQSAANMVRAANGVPTVDPDKTAFATIVTATGITAATLAALVVAMDAASVTNLAILITLENAAAAATTSAQLATALATYETALTGLVTSLNAAGLTTIIQAPTAISIVGINA